MEIHKGTGRITFLIGPLAFKLIRLDCLFNFVKNMICSSKDYRDKAKTNWGETRWRIVRGIMSNITEWATYTATRANFLAPTYITLGFLNISKRIDGEPVSPDEIFKLITQNLPGKKSAIWHSIDPHSILDNSGWRKNNHGLFLLDYGDTFGQGIPLSSVITSQRRLVEEILDKYESADN